MTEYPWVKMRKRVCDIHIVVDRIAMGASFARAKRKAKRALGLFCHHAVNVFLFPFGYRWLDARYGIGQETCLSLGVQDISDTTTKALVARRAEKTRPGLALRYKTDDSHTGRLTTRIMADDDGFPLTYWQRGKMSWRIKS